MSLSQHDRRVLADIEQQLSRQDPWLAQTLGSFGRPASLRTCLLRVSRRRVPTKTMAFWCLAAVVLMVVGIAAHSAAAVVMATGLVGVLALTRLTGRGWRPPRGRHTDR